MCSEKLRRTKQSIDLCMYVMPCMRGCRMCMQGNATEQVPFAGCPNPTLRSTVTVALLAATLLSYPHITHIITHTYYTYFHVRNFILENMQSELQPRVDAQRTPTTPTPHMEIWTHISRLVQRIRAPMQTLFPHEKKSAYKHRPPPLRGTDRLVCRE